ncbi:Homeobox domain [Macleaya cordata]|uniref:Homeobox domain n=1 Tax=Macleaya cordata TaxID=56857 RepID=A0A200QRF2_MACCD|nr:Homeobox domain [Macleaya cordata]
MGEEEEECDIGLSLRLGSGEYTSRRTDERKRQVQLNFLFPSHPKKEIVDYEVHDDDRSSSKTVNQNEEHAIKKDNTSVNSHINKYGTTRKKLRLTKEQSALLESSFKEHNTPNMAQKQELAERLDLRPRQVEVWFQNRRARTKLKKTEVDCEVLKKCCESLKEENRRLKKELQELRSIKFGLPSPFYVQLPKTAALTVCPTCERIAKTSTTDDKNNMVLDVMGKSNKF